MSTPCWSNSSFNLKIVVSVCGVTSSTSVFLTGGVIRGRRIYCRRDSDVCSSDAMRGALIACRRSGVLATADKKLYQFLQFDRRRSRQQPKGSEIQDHRGQQVEPEQH